MSGAERRGRIPHFNDDSVEAVRRDDGKSFHKFCTAICKTSFYVICSWSRHGQLIFLFSIYVEKN